MKLMLKQTRCESSLKEHKWSWCLNKQDVSPLSSVSQLFLACYKMHTQNTAFITRLSFVFKLTHLSWVFKCFLFKNRSFIVLIVRFRSNRMPLFTHLNFMHMLLLSHWFLSCASVCSSMCSSFDRMPKCSFMYKVIVMFKFQYYRHFTFPLFCNHDLNSWLISWCSSKFEAAIAYFGYIHINHASYNFISWNRKNTNWKLRI